MLIVNLVTLLLFCCHARHPGHPAKACETALASCAEIFSQCGSNPV